MKGIASFGVAAIVGVALLTRLGGWDSADPSLLSAWIVNTAGTTSGIYTSTPVDVQSVSRVNQNNKIYALVESSDIPSYSTVVTRPLLDMLRSRPRARTDFRDGGEPSIAVGQTVNFGQDIGFRGRSCASTPATGSVTGR